jgi:hypothetical protein
MHPLAKAFLGCLLLIGGVAWTWFFKWQFVEVLLGFIGPFVALIAIFIIWLEIDEWRIERELKAEEERVKARRRRGRPRKK